MRGVGLHLLRRQPRARHVAPGRIADQTGEIADQEDHLVTELLKLAHLVDQHRVAQVQVGCRGIEARLDAQRLPRAELVLQLRGHQQVLRPARELRAFVRVPNPR